jgi:hypothetical protein
MAKPKKTDFQLISDQPLIEGKSIEWDGLGFKEYADALGHAAWATPGPFTFGIFGEWGVGKTSLMRLIENSLNTKHNEKVLTVWFNAWRYERAGLTLAFGNNLRKEINY